MFQGPQEQNLCSPYSHSLGESAGLSSARGRGSGSCPLQGLLEGASATLACTAPGALHCLALRATPSSGPPFNCPSPWQTAARTPGTAGISNRTGVGAGIRGPGQVDERLH